jgi:hypothetical protein
MLIIGGTALVGPNAKTAPNHLLVVHITTILN